MGATGRPTVRMVKALVMVGAIMLVLLQLASAGASSHHGTASDHRHNRRSRRLGAPSGAPLSAPSNGPLFTIEDLDRSEDGARRYLSAIALAQSPYYDAYPPYYIPVLPPPPPYSPLSAPPFIPQAPPPPPGAPWSSPVITPPHPPAPTLVPPSAPVASSSGSPSAYSQVPLIAGLSVTVGVLLGSILVGLLLFCCFRRRRSNRDTNTRGKMPRPENEGVDKQPRSDNDGWDKSPPPQEDSPDKRAIQEV